MFDRKDGVDMSNFKKSFATMFAAIMMLTGIIILGTSTVAKAVTYPLSQNIDFGADGELTVNLKPTSPTTVKGNANISTGIEIDATGLHKPIDGLYLEIEVNTKQSSTDINNTNNITPDTYLETLLLQQQLHSLLSSARRPSLPLMVGPLSACTSTLSIPPLSWSSLTL